ncbi:YhgE/Pip domain-containing protein [Lentibacillus cibarius]|uniref:YhgE/Pip domain-containing protein n=1 Tax=Lentibacillus cibarius TaxID=2583219 RepID=A0A549YF49_9BACI|nr:YhgE/Pip domain-containing protein [Lentibacillus cibarius]TMN21576.1 YhgE/Pip domain-containing protein [Lentibacillus cibarius]TRM10478.1 YhgE/Pip domain-containing protein [Lentibacillus cibarius]
MKNTWNIYSGDLKNITRNWVAAILIGGLIILPSLYAWFNIKASWDPYGQTDQIPIGIVNEDTGSEVRGNEIDVGADLVDTLKGSDAMDWQFTHREAAMDKLKHGDYFAVIVIPDDFSAKLATVVNDNPEKSNVEYYVNEKINAISPKITDKGVSTIVEEISSKFISTVNGVIFEMFNDIGVELNKNLPDIKKFEDYVFTMEEKLPKIHDLLENGVKDTDDIQAMIDRAQKTIPKAEQATANGLSTVNDTVELLSKAQSRLNELAPKVKQDLKKAQGTADDIHQLLQDVQNLDIDFSKGKQLQGAINNSLSDTISRIEGIEKKLQYLQNRNQGNGNMVIAAAIERLEALRAALGEMKENGNRITSFIANKEQEVDSIIADLKELSGNTANRIGELLKDYNETIAPEVKQTIDQAQGTLANAKDILGGIQATIPEVKQVLANTENHIGQGQKLLHSVLGEYPYVHDKVNQLAARIRAIQDETDINKMIELLKNNPEAERGFFSEPVQLHKNEIFPIPNYGSGMTPFYTVLAIWVGGLLLISLLATDVHHAEGLTGRERYAGKLLTFLTIGLLQTLIVTLGDLFLLDTYTVHPVWFVVFGLLISMVFMVMIYTLVSLFGDVGKAGVIVLLVLQIAGAGGTYPVVLLPAFFQVINPFLPFTYAIDLMREAVGGIIWKAAIQDIIVLTCIGLGFLLFGLLFKNVVNKHTEKLMKKSREAGLFH